MSIVKLLDDYLLEHGNKRFLEGWNGATEHIIKLLEEIITERQQVEQTINVLNEISNLRYLIALIKGEK